MLLTLAASGYQPTGLDLSPQMGHIARQRIAAANTAVPLVQGRGQGLPFQANSFDSILTTFPTPYIAAPETLAALGRVLRPGGQLVIVPEAQLSGRDPVSRFLEWLYAITGQRPHRYDKQPEAADYWQTLLARQPFHVTTHVIPCGRSTVTVVVAEHTSIP